MMDRAAEECPLCNFPIDDTKPTVVLKEKGCETINRHSIQRDLPIKVVSGQSVHIDCRRDFTHYRNASKCALDKNNNYVTRSNEIFDFKTSCLFCGKHAKINNRKRGIDVYPVRTFEFQEKVTLKCNERSDAWAQQVLSRISPVNDLPAADAIYHQQCNVNFRTSRNIPKCFTDADERSPKRSPGRPDHVVITSSFQEVVSFVEENEGTILTMGQLTLLMSESCGERAYSRKHMKRKLQDYFGDKLSITTLEGKEDKVCLKKTLSEIVHKESVCESEENRRKGIIKEAAKILKEDIDKIRSNKVYFPIVSSISSLAENKDFLPENLILLLSSIFSSCDDVILTSIGQAIIQACHPKNILAPLQLGLGVQLHYMYGSRYLIDLLHKMGFSTSYSQVQRYEANAAATLNTTLPDFFPGKFLQFVADNVDHNICTLDGNGTFHGMGIIACTTPGSDMKMPVPKKEIPLEEIVKLGKIDIKCVSSRQDISREKFDNLLALTLNDTDNQEDPNCYFDIFCKAIWSLDVKRPMWSGFMQMYYHSSEENVTKTGISFMPMINLNPSDPTCINSTLHFVCTQSSRYGVSPVITFDQPLFQKASDIISCCPSSDPFKSIVLRLGAFHTIMSYLGSIGHIMASSGLQEVLEIVYAPYAVTAMLTGKSVSRALRGHFMVDTALHAMLLSKCVGITVKSLEDDMQEKDNIDGEKTTSDMVTNEENFPTGEENIEERLSELYKKLEEKKIGKSEVIDSSTMDYVVTKLNATKESLAKNKTASLWIQYMDMVFILQQFIRAERIGDWNGHLHTLRKMLPYFAASGHNLYLKSAYIYLQNMLQLKKNNPDVHKQFLDGNHAVRRTERRWSGLSTDLVIEQVLMRSLKSTGGVTRGRGMSETQMAVWLMSMPANAEMSNAMQEMTGTKYVTSEQHKDNRHSRIVRDDKDTKQIFSFLCDHSPFDETDGQLRNIENGIAADNRVNVEQARSVGEKIVENMCGKFIDEYSFKRSSQVVTLASKTSIRSTGEEISIDPQLLFQRLTAIADRYYDDISGLFQYELSSVPSSLFESTGIPRMAQKSQLADAIWKLGDCGVCEEDTKTPHYVLDGGSLLHRISWTKNMTFGTIFDLYRVLISQTYAKATVVFDGYKEGPSIKDTTHLRRCNGIVGNHVKFGPETPCKLKKEKFLSNAENKQAFIEHLGAHLLNHNINIRFAPGDADMLIAETAIEQAEHDTTYVIGEDTDLLVLLCYHVQNTSKNIYFRSDIKRGKPSMKKIWDIKKTQSILTRKVCDLLPFLHALTGCDSTSRIYGIGKSSALKTLIKNSELQKIGTDFMESTANKDVAKYGEKAMSILLDGDPMLTLDTLRYQKFTLKVMTGKTYVQVHTLPPTSAAAYYHSLRVYLQSQIWIGNKTLSPENWGWMLCSNRLTPIKSSKPPAPDALLNVIRCNCKLNCDSKKCSCRKHGLECSLSCGSCRGIGCSNTPTLTELEYDEMI